MLQLIQLKVRTKLCTGLTYLHVLYTVGEGRDATTSTAQPKTVAPLQQQHPLQIVHKMPGLKSDRSTGSTSANSAGTLQQPTHSGSSSSFSRNQRLRKLPPGRPVAAGMDS